MHAGNVLKVAMAAAVCLFSFMTVSSGVSFAAASLSPEQELQTKQACLAATLNAIKMEMKRYQGWIDLRKSGQVRSEDLPRLEASMAELKKELASYQGMSARDYQLPKPVDMTAWLRGKAKDNAILNFSGLTKSGPWYHLAGVTGGDYSAMKPDVKYNISFYPVYKREYGFMRSFYIYISDISEKKSL
jgi:hypothetical protein